MYAIRFTVEELDKLNNSIQENVSKGNLSRIGDLHAVISGMKTWCTYMCYEGIETVR